jgi:hypothetical protein
METVNLKTKVVLFVDNGMNFQFAVRMVPSFKKVYYFTPWNVNGFPRPNDRYPGFGFEGITTIDDIFERSEDKDGYSIDRVDLFCFLFLYYGPIQRELIKQGKRVWGARNVEKLELDRTFLNQTLKSMNLPVAHTVVKKGIKAAREYLKTVKNKYIKISKYRDAFETFHHIDYDHSEFFFDDLEERFGFYKEEMEFLIQDDIKSIIEIGYDGWIINGEYPQSAMLGFEIKDCAYLMKTLSYEELPKPLKTINERFSDYFKGADYGGFYSNETRITENKVCYLTDATERLPSPPGEVYPVIINNLPEILWKGAEGKIIEPVYNAKYAGLVVMTSEWLEHGNPLYVEIPESIKNNVSLQFACKIDGKVRCIPQGEGFGYVGSIIATGNTVEEVINKLKDMTKQVKAFDLVFETEGLDKAVESIKDLEKIGVKF